jgi:hypothetical protein
MILGSVRLFLGRYDSTKGWFRASFAEPFFDLLQPSEAFRVTFTRLWADRRTGNDRRSEPRRRIVMVVTEERRQVVDRRRGAERRSTLDRRGRTLRIPNAERPVEHIRNALQLLREVAMGGELSAGPSDDLSAAIERLHRAVGLLERQRR